MSPFLVLVCMSCSNFSINLFPYDSVANLRQGQCEELSSRHFSLSNISHFHIHYLLCIHDRKRMQNVKLWKTNQLAIVPKSQAGAAAKKWGGGQQLHTLGGFTFRQWNCFNPLSPHVELTVLQHHYQSAHTKHAALVLLACSLGLFSVHGITELIPCHALAANFCEGFISHSVFFLFPAKWKCHGQRQSRAKQKGDPPKCWPVSLARWMSSTSAGPPAMSTSLSNMLLLR